MLAHGIIPARAGFTAGPPLGRLRCRDHPRSRGVYSTTSASVSSLAGSSPLARGLRIIKLQPKIGSGIIPARAGFTTQTRFFYASSWDHPRSRGVYPAVWVSTMPTDGSSPLARGLLAAAEAAGDRTRIIPARAGFTWPDRSGCRFLRDHPRSRGVYRMKILLAAYAGGSSPLARGLHQWRGERGRRPRIIPARAGFTWRPRLRGRAARDHPRSRGVYPLGSGCLGPADGSSPLARGLQAILLQSVEQGRIIPARAGFTAGLERGETRMEDHPRSRGVYA